MKSRAQNQVMMKTFFYTAAFAILLTATGCEIEEHEHHHGGYYGHEEYEHGHYYQYPERHYYWHDGYYGDDGEYHYYRD